jgi:hypothetical protein
MKPDMLLRRQTPSCMDAIVIHGVEDDQWEGEGCLPVSHISKIVEGIHVTAKVASLGATRNIRSSSRMRT